MTRGSFLVAASLLALAACLSSANDLSVDKPAANDAGSAVDANAPALTSDADIPPVDDAGTSPGDGCVPNLSTRDAGDIAPLGSFDPIGSATVDGTTVLLTPIDPGSQAGALWRTSAIAFDHFDMTAGFRIKPGPDEVGDGLSFAWTSESSLPSVDGLTGAEVGVAGLPGYAIVIDEYGEAYPVPPPLVALVDLTKQAPDQWTLQAKTIATPVEDDKEHFLHVTFDSGVVTVHIDDELLLDHVAIAGYAPYIGRWGFGAGTGGATAEHRITRVSFVDPSTSCE